MQEGFTGKSILQDDTKRRLTLFISAQLRLNGSIVSPLWLIPLTLAVAKMFGSSGRHGLLGLGLLRAYVSTDWKANSAGVSVRMCISLESMDFMVFIDFMVFMDSQGLHENP